MGRHGPTLKKGQYLSYLVKEFCCRKSSFRKRAVSRMILSPSARESCAAAQAQPSSLLAETQDAVMMKVLSVVSDVLGSRKAVTQERLVNSYAQQLFPPGSDVAWTLHKLLQNCTEQTGPS